MSQIIADIYEIENQIGAGGGGIVYLGRHLRLEKPVVLKADKRTLNTKPEMLRREVDMLKDLSHRYIPQVYDFVQEEGIVYTVMDFVEGESFDKILNRKQQLSQPQIIRWACQLLEALSYLHSRPPHGILHGDIKPANIMLRSDGDICLIDYNIAPALGEDGAVKAGFSRGYASPESYGEMYVSSKKPPTIHISSISTKPNEKSDMNESKTEKLFESSSGSTSGRNAVLLDVRSDIYSLGATLYHLLSGQRPAPKAGEVIPLSGESCSPAVAAIIQKAMMPDPQQRYQTADEMLAAFRQLYKKDGRVIRRKKCMAVSAAVLAALFLGGGGCTFAGLRQMEQTQEALVLAERSKDALEKGDVAAAVLLAMQAIPEEKDWLAGPVTAQVQRALADALGVYDLSDGFKPYGTLTLPSAPFTMEMSPGGRYAAIVYAYELAVFDLEKSEKIAVLPVQESALSDVVFLDENRIVYAGREGVTAYDLEQQSVLWSGEEATMLAVSGDAATIAAVDRKEEGSVLYRAADGKKIAECSFDGRHIDVPENDIFADAGNAIFSLNQDGSRMAVSFSDGGLVIYDWQQAENSIILHEESDYIHFGGGFSGDYFAYTAAKDGESMFRLIDVGQAQVLGDYESKDRFLISVDERGIYLAEGNLLVKIQPQTLQETELAYTENHRITGFTVGKEYTLVSTDDGSFAFYDKGAHKMSSEKESENCNFMCLTENYAIIGNRNEPLIRLMCLENHEKEQLLSYDARYVHDEARISQDGKTAMLFSYQDFRIYNMNGELLAEAELPEAEQIYDQQFRRSEEGAWLEVIWYDGTRRCYSASDGALISESIATAPEKNLQEEFYTAKYRVVSSLHEAPKVYDLISGRMIAELERDAYLTYVTQVGDYLLTEYVSAEGDRYGLLLDEQFQTLAYLPGLCDLVNGMAVFDYESGNLRQCRLYSLQELMALGETMINK